MRMAFAIFRTRFLNSIPNNLTAFLRTIFWGCQHGAAMSHSSGCPLQVRHGAHAANPHRAFRFHPAACGRRNR